MNAMITVAYVAVNVPVYDCEGTQRVICFPRIGNRLYGAPSCHWTAKPFIGQAKIAAAKCLKESRAK